MSENLEKVVEGISEYIIGVLYSTLEKSSPPTPEEKYRFAKAVIKIKERLRYSISKANEEDRGLILSLYDEIQRLSKSEDPMDKIRVEYKSKRLSQLVEKITSEGKENIFSYAIKQLEYVKGEEEPEYKKEESQENKKTSPNKSMVLGLIVALGSLFLFNFIDFSTQGMFLTQPQGSALYIFFSVVVFIYLFYFLFKK
ncbi:MAG: hypothetical protein QXL86_01320 [Candidatus Aenigmatarchaeota archaeon]